MRIQPLSYNDSIIYEKENSLRKWFTHGLDPIQKVIDGFDIGWGGTASWVTKTILKFVNPKNSIKVLDFACGYGTFLAELGWRFPNMILYGLNLDFQPPHSAINPLLQQAEVEVQLMEADVLFFPFRYFCFDMITCFLGLQDIEITRGIESLPKVLSNLLNHLEEKKLLVIIDNFPLSKFNYINSKITPKYYIKLHDFYQPRCQWSYEVGLRAIDLYSKGYLQQLLDSESPPQNPVSALKNIRNQMIKELNAQIKQNGYFNPWKTMHLFVYGKK